MVSESRVSLRGYDVVVARGAIARVGEIARNVAPAHRFAIITDTNVGPHYASRVHDALGASRTVVLTIPAGERHKTREQWAALTDELLGAGFGRDSTIIALGGGVVGDLAGFIAATFMRGVPYIQVPTSLLAMIDASVGGKTGVDTPAGKNLVGAFHRPAAVIADTATLATLPANHLRAGLAEAIKHGVVADAEYFDRVVDVASRLDALDLAGSEMAALVTRSVEIKADIVGRDEHESGMRKVLNFGHTIGHAVELCSGFALLHGEAVAIGMVSESEVAERMGIARPGTAARIREAVRGAGLPADRPSSITADAVIEGARGDKKARAGMVEYAFPSAIGSMAASDRGWSMPVSDAIVRAVLAQDVPDESTR